MKLPKHNSEPLHIKAMKLKFILPFYLALASITFCSRKISDGPDPIAKIDPAPTPASITVPSTITGDLELDEATNTIYADLWLEVSNSNYMYAHDFMTLESDNKYKGIAFRYYDTANNAPDSGRDSTRIHVVFNFTNENDWKLDDQVRVMSFNEETHSTFNNLRDYFIKRMDHFEENPCSHEALVEFNDEWNKSYPSNQVTTGMVVSNSAPQQKKAGRTKSIPRLTKDDGILTLRLKR